MKPNLLLSIFIFCSVVATTFGQKYTNTEEVKASKIWNGITFSSEKSFAENIKASDSFSFLNTILENDALCEELGKPEMVTIFAPTDAGFITIPEKSRDSLLANPKKVTAMVKFYSVPGRLDKNSLEKALEQNGGTVYLKTLQGAKLGVKEINGKLVLFDSENNTAVITETNFYHKNGFFHIVEGLVFPPSEDQ